MAEEDDDTVPVDRILINCRKAISIYQLNAETLGRLAGMDGSWAAEIVKGAVETDFDTALFIAECLGLKTDQALTRDLKLEATTWDRIMLLTRVIPMQIRIDPTSGRRIGETDIREGNPYL